MGNLIVDQGCADALIKHGSSLLPVGIKCVEGRFHESDIVTVTYEGNVIAKGIVNYNSVNINAIKGLQSDCIKMSSVMMAFMKRLFIAIISCSCSEEGYHGIGSNT